MTWAVAIAALLAGEAPAPSTVPPEPQPAAPPPLPYVLCEQLERTGLIDQIRVTYYPRRGSLIDLSSVELALQMGWTIKTWAVVSGEAQVSGAEIFSSQLVPEDERKNLYLTLLPDPEATWIDVAVPVACEGPPRLYRWRIAMPDEAPPGQVLLPVTVVRDTAP